MSTEISSAVKQIRLQEWVRQIRDCQSRPQGMTVAEWCRLNGISKTNYYYRLKSVRKACLDQLPQKADSRDIVPVSQELLSETFQGMPAQSGGIEISCGQFRIHVTDSTSPALLETVLRVASNVK